MDKGQASRLGIASYADPGVNISVNAANNGYVFWVDSLPVPQAGQFWLVHAMLAQMFQVTNNQASLSGIFVCGPGTKTPTMTDTTATAIALPGYVRVDDMEYPSGAGVAAPALSWEKAVGIAINGQTMGQVLEPNPPKRDIIVPPLHFIRFLAVFGGSVPTKGQWYSLLNILYEQEPTC